METDAPSKVVENGIHRGGGAVVRWWTTVAQWFSMAAMGLWWAAVNLDSSYTIGVEEGG
jgi:hypothetical protein